MGLGALPLAITILVAPAQLKMEEGVAPATVTVTVTAPGSAATHLRLWCSTGALSRARELGNGRFAASYAPPAAGKPTFAVLAAWDEQSGEAAAATVVLVGRTEIPVETEPGAQVVAVVHGRRSVARANAAGHARVPAWVWPGDRNATVTAIDAAGNATTQELPLELPPPDGVFLLAPAEVAAGQPVPVWAFATGTTTPELAVTGGGSLSSIALRPGVASARLQARAEVTLTALGAGDRAEQRIRMATTTPPPARSIALGPQPSQRTPPPAPSTPSPPKGGPPSGGRRCAPRASRRCHPGSSEPRSAAATPEPSSAAAASSPRAAASAASPSASTSTAATPTARSRATTSAPAASACASPPRCASPSPPARRSSSPRAPAATGQASAAPHPRAPP